MYKLWIKEDIAIKIKNILNLMIMKIYQNWGIAKVDLGKAYSHKCTC